jgi:hypothetical protein
VFAEAYTNSIGVEYVMEMKILVSAVPNLKLVILMPLQQWIDSTYASFHKTQSEIAMVNVKFPLIVRVRVTEEHV